MEAEIKKFMIDKGGVVVTGVVNEMLLDIHGCYEKNKPFLGALGGQIQQWYYVVSAILKIYNGPTELADYYNRKRANPTADESNKAFTARELMLEQFFVPFMVIAIKELKCETLQLMASPQLMKVIETLKCSTPSSGNPYDLTKLTRDNYLQFRYAFVEELNHHEILSNNENPDAMKMIMSALAMIMCKRVPEGVVPFKVDDLAKKIRLMPIPKGLETIER